MSSKANDKLGEYMENLDEYIRLMLLATTAIICRAIPGNFTLKNTLPVNPDMQSTKRNSVDLGINFESLHLH